MSCRPTHICKSVVKKRHDHRSCRFSGSVGFWLQEREIRNDVPAENFGADSERTFKFVVFGADRFKGALLIDLVEMGAFVSRKEEGCLLYTSRCV